MSKKLDGPVAPAIPKEFLDKHKHILDDIK